jgi:hypothetical protein
MPGPYENLNLAMMLLMIVSNYLLMIVSNHLCNNEGSNPLTHCVLMIRSQLIKDISASNLVETYDDNLSPDLIKGNVMLLCSRISQGW